MAGPKQNSSWFVGRSHETNCSESHTCEVETKKHETRSLQKCKKAAVIGDNSNNLFELPPSREKGTASNFVNPFRKKEILLLGFISG